jgi:phenylalanyl-tRNA synthetase beta chain
MWEYGQPLHAFDYACLEGKKIVVRRARKGETLDTLDGNPRVLQDAMLVIADAQRPIAVAGVMGGANSEITAATVDIVLESANFNGPSVRHTAIALGMRTDASSRFEKGLDAYNTLPAITRACELIEKIGAGTVASGVLDQRAAESGERAIPFEPDRINALLGCSLSEQTMREMLISLGFSFTGGTAAVPAAVAVPSWRSDVARTADLAEEVARLYGYDALPTTTPLMRSQPVLLTQTQKIRRTLTDAALALGFDEMLSYSFLSPQDYDRVSLPEEKRNSLRILNPLGEDKSIMRTTALPGLLEALARNVNHRAPSVRLFELATTYLPDASETMCAEPQTLTLGAYGESMNFYALKGMIEAVLMKCRVQYSDCVPCGEQSYHPGQCAELLADGIFIGRFGQIHPTVAERYGVNVPLYAAELSVAGIMEAANPERRYTQLPRYPTVSRDLALVCRRDLPAGTLTKTIKAEAGPLLRDVELFDVYTGPQIAGDLKSIAFALTFRADDRTLTDADTDAAIANVLAALERDHGAVLRR